MENKINRLDKVAIQQRIIKNNKIKIMINIIKVARKKNKLSRVFKKKIIEMAVRLMNIVQNLSVIL